MYAAVSYEDTGVAPARFRSLRGRAMLWILRDVLTYTYK